MTKALAMPMQHLILAVALTGCQSDLSAVGLADGLAHDRNTRHFNDTVFEMRSCTITPERTAICTLTVTNRYRDKRIEIDRRITIQDDTGTDHQVTAGGFGVTPNRPQWNQLAVADSSYQLTVMASNLSTRASAVRAVVFTRLLVRSPQGQAMGYRDQVIFSRPPMIAGTDQDPPETRGQTPDLDANTWHVVGYWNYDANDGQHLATQGLVLREQAGGGLGHTWQAHLELKNHAALPQRARSLWPVKIHPASRKVCADYPGYPTYSTFIDMPGGTNDGVYTVARCKGG